MQDKVFYIRGKARKSVAAYPFNSGNGLVSYTDKKEHAERMNKIFGAPKLPAREEPQGAA